MTSPTTPGAQSGLVAETGDWMRICDAGQVMPERAVAALTAAGEQVAIARTADGRLHAVGHHDPYAQANVIARGIVGTRTVDGEVHDVIQSPLFKQAFDLTTGQDVVDPAVSLGTWAVRERDGMIELGPRTSEASAPEKTTR